MRKKLLFVIDSLAIGGAEKSLLSLLNLIDPSKFEVDLLLFKQDGDLEKYVPRYINIIPSPEYFQFIRKEKRFINNNTIYFSYRLKTSLCLRINQFKKTPRHTEQVVFKSINKLINPLNKNYDAAISYSQGMPTYFVANKVIASKKLAWINTDYVHTLYDKEVDYQSYKKIDKIIAVSQHIKESVGKINREYEQKLEMILDIINPNMINQMSEEFKAEEFEESTINILTVGRLVSAKAYDKAIEAARLLKNSGYKFRWFAVGEGPERNKLQQLINQYELQDCFVLLGKKLNPYPYMKACDLYVQSSIKEGFGLTVMEAKILKKPIVCTGFPTAKEIIHNHVDGLIVQHDIEAIFKGVKKYLDDEPFRKRVIHNLNSIEPYNSVNQLEKFYQLIDNQNMVISL